MVGRSRPLLTWLMTKATSLNPSTNSLKLGKPLQRRGGNRQEIKSGS